MPHRVSTFLRNSSTSLEAQVASLKKATTRRPSSTAHTANTTNTASTVSATASTTPRSSTSSSSRRRLPASQRPFSYASSLGDDDDHDSTAAADVPRVAAPVASPTSMTTTSMTASMTSLQRTTSAERREAQAAAAADAQHHGHSHHGHSHHHRRSFGGLHFGRTSRETHANPNVVLDWRIESPPIVLYGDAENSTGALVSGLLFLTVKDEPVHMDTFVATLHLHVTQKRPYAAHCHDCVHQHTELQKWTLLHAPTTLGRGQHGFPFSVLLPGHLPATMDGPLVAVAYEFRAEAVPAAGSGTPIKFEKLFDVKRALPPPELPHHSVRIFPPTNIKASVHFPQVIHPIGQNTLSLRIDGVTRLNPKVHTLEFWKLKKLTWRIEETAKSRAPACPRHAPAAAVEAGEDGSAAAASEDSKKVALRTETRVIGEKTLLGGWKNNYAGPDDSSVELELDYALSKGSSFACDTRTRDGGIEVTHQLMLELVVSQEWAPANKPQMATQTGVGRILRMHFTDILTERGGIGVSWDNEAPPIYQDVPPSPPSYCEEIGPPVPTDTLEPLDGQRT